MKLMYVLVGVAIIHAACQPANAPQPQPQAPEQPAYSPYATVDTATYAIVLQEEQYILKNRKNGQSWTIPKKQLMPPVESPELEPEMEPQYGPKVMAFRAGKGRVCLYLNSYEIADGGSMALAEGYDIFLLLDTVSNKLLPEVLHLGQTRGRYKAMGYLHANYTKLYVSHPPQIEDCWIGTRKEQVYMTWDNETGVPNGGPYHDIEPLIWYHFNGTSWVHDPRHDRLFPCGKGAGELPPTTSFTPIDMAIQAYRDRRF